MFVWDEHKNLANKDKHGLTFEAIHHFDWESSVIVDRSRHADGEKRMVAIGKISNKLHTVIFTHRGHNIRLISLRRSNKAEEKLYEQNT